MRTDDPTANRPMLSVVIPTYNGRALLSVCLASVERNRPPGLDLEVVVVDDGSTDGTVEWLAEVYPSARVVARERNGGFVAAANDGLAAARGHFVQLLNNDTEVMPGWAEAGLSPFADPRVGSVAPLVLWRTDPSRVDSAGDCYLLCGLPIKRGHGEPVARWAAHSADEVFGPSASSAFYRAEALARTGGFDPGYGSYYEDVDLAFRLRWAGYRCVFAPRCRILHEVSATYDHTSPALQRRLSRNAERLFWSNVPLRWMPLAVPAHLGFLTLQGLRNAALGRFRPWLLGKLDAMGQGAEIVSLRQNRGQLARAAGNRPHFRLESNLARESFARTRRLREASAARPAASQGPGAAGNRAV
jgi:GT2 family glycosyltransferase